MNRQLRIDFGHRKVARNIFAYLFPLLPKINSAATLNEQLRNAVVRSASVFRRRFVADFASREIHPRMLKRGVDIDRFLKSQGIYPETLLSAPQLISARNTVGKNESIRLMFDPGGGGRFNRRMIVSSQQVYFFHGGYCVAVLPLVEIKSVRCVGFIPFCQLVIGTEATEHGSSIFCTRHLVKRRFPKKKGQPTRSPSLVGHFVVADNWSIGERIVLSLERASQQYITVTAENGTYPLALSSVEHIFSGTYRDRIICVLKLTDQSRGRWWMIQVDNKYVTDYVQFIAGMRVRRRKPYGVYDGFSCHAASTMVPIIQTLHLGEADAVARVRTYLPLYDSRRVIRDDRCIELPSRGQMTHHVSRSEITISGNGNEAQKIVMTYSRELAFNPPA